MFKLSEQAERFLTQSYHATKMVQALMDEAIAEARAQGYGVEFFMDEIIITDPNGGRDAKDS